MSILLILFGVLGRNLAQEYADYFPCTGDLEYVGPVPMSYAPWKCSTMTDKEIDETLDAACFEKYGAGARNIRGVEIDDVIGRPSKPTKAWAPGCDNDGDGCGGSCADGGLRICRAYDSCTDPWDISGPPFGNQGGDSCYRHASNEPYVAVECVRCNSIQTPCKAELIAGIPTTVGELNVYPGSRGLRVLSPGATCTFLPARNTPPLNNADINGCDCGTGSCLVGHNYWIEITAVQTGPSGAHVYGGCGDVVSFPAGESFFLVDNTGTGVGATGTHLTNCNWINPNNGNVLLLNDCDYTGSLNPVGIRVTLSQPGDVQFNCI